MEKKKKIKLKKVKSLFELRQLAESDTGYLELALTGARNLGGNPKDLNEAMRWLKTNADETDENGVLGEVNFVRDIVEKKLNEA